jgi:multiple sugar transport system permease protein
MVGLTVIPVIALFSFVVVLPVSWAILSSFFRVPLYASDQWTWMGLQNYIGLITDTALQASLWRALLFALGSVIFQLVVGVGLALLINRPFKSAPVIRAIILLPYLIPTAAVAFISLWMANSQWGIINQLLVSGGIINGPIPWFASQDLAMISVILASSWKFAIFVTLMVLARLQGIPDEFYEAATMAGANFYQRFRDITLPNLKGVIFIVILLRGIWMFNKFDILYILTGGGPGNTTTTVPIFAYELAFTTGELSQANTVATMMFALIAIAAGIYFYTLKPAEEVRVE